MLLNCGVGEDSWESHGLQGDQPVNPKGNQPWMFMEGLLLKLKLHTLATWCKELTHWERPWCWERLKARGEGDDRGWDGWMASLWLLTLDKFEQTPEVVKDREAWPAAAHWVTKSWTHTHKKELDTTKWLNNNKKPIYTLIWLYVIVLKKRVKHSKLSMPRCSLGTRFTF